LTARENQSQMTLRRRDEQNSIQAYAVQTIDLADTGFLGGWPLAQSAGDSRAHHAKLAAFFFSRCRRVSQVFQAAFQVGNHVWLAFRYGLGLGFFNSVTDGDIGH
jgi:hypothetical protein